MLPCTTFNFILCCMLIVTTLLQHVFLFFLTKILFDFVFNCLLFLFFMIFFLFSVPSLYARWNIVVWVDLIFNPLAFSFQVSENLSCTKNESKSSRVLKLDWFENVVLNCANRIDSFVLVHFLKLKFEKPRMHDWFEGSKILIPVNSYHHF